MLRRFILLFLGFSFPMGSFSEEVYFFNRQRPLLSMAEMVKTSQSSAHFIAEGYFIPLDSKQTLTDFGGGEGMQLVAFHLTRWLGNAMGPQTSVLRLKLPIYIPFDISKCGSRIVEDSPLMSISRDLEMEMISKFLEPENYLDRLSKAREPLLAAANYMDDFVIVRVNTGALDARYRTADVVVQFNKKYVFFVMRSIIDDNIVSLFPNGLDIYNSNDPVVSGLLREKSD